ncbi:hypothetical protein CN97_00865 [Haematobacter massiliensis]|uniref:Uncharacterized protein n=1 Tax=Haematobacter massiliensis TaxID=195105 RepID=A0A086Y0J3_9RHOB|nr:winged helix-turn-helix domain-containing protein [Haematobacter massiliensis]KFI27793.1 hypothetical protein CN97_00865 [Haematobacter massiliensis]OWJ82734.1 winged helix-turn-helix domain-containing protein [Haematobacter massiliensis]
MKPPRDWYDHEILTALQFRDEGYSLGAIARAMGKSKGAVQGKLRRLDRDYAASEAGLTLVHPLLG